MSLLIALVPMIFNCCLFCHPAYVDDSHINCWIYIWFILEFGTESTIS